ncbi:MAG: FAD-dependent oxidoreductase [Verrucomicrobiia bacterium]
MDTTPYWFGADLPTFPEVDRDLSVDALVIGGGITGITAAVLLKQLGAKVALVERQRCAGRDTGHTTAHLTWVTDTRLHKLVNTFGRDAAKAFWDAGAAAIDQIHQFVQAGSIPCEFRWVPGYLHEALGESNGKDCDSLKEDAALSMELGFGGEFLEQTPFAGRPGVRFRNQAKFHPRRYLAGLVEQVPGDGSFVFENSGVSEIEGKKALTADVGRHKIQCQFVVVATHSPIMGTAGLVKSSLFQTKLALYTSYVVGARLPHQTLPEALFWDTNEPYYYLRIDRHEDHDDAIFGGEDCKTGQGDDAQAAFRRLEQRLAEVLPGAEVRNRWLGQVVETHDGLPFIGEIAENQFVATGFAGNGMTLGTVGAMMARDHFAGSAHPWSELFEVSRRKIRGGGWSYITENLDYPYHMLRDRVARADLPSTDLVRLGEGAITKVDGKKVAAYRDESGKLTLLSPVCTHLGCIVRWNTADKTWDCPCHGSRFKPTGEVFGGPAETPLKPFES